MSEPLDSLDPLWFLGLDERDPEAEPPPRAVSADDELKAIRGNPTHGVDGIHIGYLVEGTGYFTLCGLRPTARACRCRPWLVVDTTEVTCAGCYEIGKRMHDEQA